MELRTNSFAAALLVLLLASSTTTTDAAPLNEKARTRASQRQNFVQAVPEAELSQKEGTGELSEEEDERHTGPSWYKLLPGTLEGEQRNSETALSVPNVGGKWEAISAQILKQVRTLAAHEKVPAVLAKLNDPEIQKNILGIVLAAAGMAATGFMLGDYEFVRQMSLVSLYVTALRHVLKSGIDLASKLASSTPEEQRAERPGNLIHEKLAKFLELRPANHSTGAQTDDQ